MCSNGKGEALVPEPTIPATPHTFPPATLAITAERQHTLHACCDIPAARWGDRVDPGLLAHEPFRLLGRFAASQRPGWGYIGLGHRIRLAAPIALGETLPMTGSVTAEDPAPRGTVLRAALRFAGPGGDHRLTIEPEALMLDPAAHRPDASGPDVPGPAAPQPDAAIPDAAPAVTPQVMLLAAKSLTPAKVRAYCADNENPAHTDPAHARRLGFRAPIAAGNQLVNLHLDALAQILGRPPQALDVTIRFRRPAFWDDTLTVEHQPATAAHPAEIRLRDPSGRLVSTCQVHALG